MLIRGLAAKNELGDIDQQIEIFERLAGKSLALQFRGAIAAVRGDYDGSARFFQELIDSDDVKESSRATSELASLEADQGKSRGSPPASPRRHPWCKDRETGEDGFASEKTVGLAFLEGLAGNRDRAVALAKDALFRSEDLRW